jgi:hypothetical protein
MGYNQEAPAYAITLSGLAGESWLARPEDGADKRDREKEGLASI